MDWKLNKKQIEEVAAMFTELCEKIADKEISITFRVRKIDAESEETLFYYDVFAIYKDKIIYIQMGDYCPLMNPYVTSDEVEEIITLLKGDK